MGGRGRGEDTRGGVMSPAQLVGVCPVLSSTQLARLTPEPEAGGRPELPATEQLAGCV